MPQHFLLLIPLPLIAPENPPVDNTEDYIMQEDIPQTNDQDMLPPSTPGPTMGDQAAPIAYLDAVEGEDNVIGPYRKRAPVSEEEESGDETANEAMLHSILDDQAIEDNDEEPESLFDEEQEWADDQDVEMGQNDGFVVGSQEQEDLDYEEESSSGSEEEEPEMDLVQQTGRPKRLVFKPNMPREQAQAQSPIPPLSLPLPQSFATQEQTHGMFHPQACNSD
jgi:hypothetical protein